MSAKRQRPVKTARSKMSKQPVKNTAAKSSKSGVTGQVRIIGGQFKRQLVPFIDADGLRPSPDRLRETLFNWVQFELHDATVLDLCAGSGALGFEALSRGAHYVTFIELQPKQAALLGQTAERLKLPASSLAVHVGDALSLIPTLALKHRAASVAEQTNLQSSDNAFGYHLVFVDPPYDLELWVPLLTALIENKLVNKHTLFYLEDRREISQTLQGLAYNYTLLKETKMGQIFASLIQVQIEA